MCGCSFRRKDVSHEGCSAGFKLDVLWVKSESMQQETIHELYHSAVIIMCCLRQSFTLTNHYDVISYVNNTLQTTEGIMNATFKLLRAELIAKGR